MDIQGVIEHMKGEFRTEIGALKTEIGSLQRDVQGIQLILRVIQDQLNAIHLVQKTQVEISMEIRQQEFSPQAKSISGTIVRALDQLPEESVPLFVPSDLLAPREGAVTVASETQNTDGLSEAAKLLGKVKKERK